VISHWANASHGLDALLNPWILVFGLAVLFLARTLGILYMMNNINDDDIRTRSRFQLAGSAFVFVVLFVVYLVHLLLKDGFAYDDCGTIFMEPNKYLHNVIDMWYLTVILLIGVVLVLYGIGKELLSGSNFFTFHFSLFTRRRRIEICRQCQTILCFKRHLLVIHLLAQREHLVPLLRQCQFLFHIIVCSLLVTLCAACQYSAQQRCDKYRPHNITILPFFINNPLEGFSTFTPFSE
jgi:hypothetical protein